MANLPDLDTSSVGFVAYWNAIDDGGVTSIEASDCLGNGNINSYTLYDNGFVADYESVTGRNITVRVKQDGWFVAYFDRSENYALEESNVENVRGYWDVVNDWTEFDTLASSLDTNTLERAINSLQSELSNSGDVTYSQSDVGLYNYEHSAATNVTLLAGMVNEVVTTETYGFLYTSGTTRHYLSAFGSQGNGGVDGDNFVQYEGVTLNNTNGEHGSYDILANAAAPNSGTEYQMTLDTGGFNGGGDVAGGILSMWS